MPQLLRILVVDDHEMVRRGQRSGQPKSAGATPDVRAIARRIRQIRGFEIRQVELAKVLGITQAQLSKYERGRNVPTLELLLKLKHFPGKSIDWIVSGDIE